MLADADTMDQLNIESLGQGLLLAGLLTHPYIKLFRYSDNGPPTSLTKRYYGEWTAAHEGWAVLGEMKHDDDFGMIGNAIYADAHGATHTGIIGNFAEIARQDIHSPAYADFDYQTAALKREADATAAQVAEAIHADVFLTNRPYLYDTRVKYASGITLLRSIDALPLISLYLRSQGVYLTYRDQDGRGTRAMNEGLYYWVGARALLPSAWRWFSGCVQQSHASGDDTLMHLGNSALQRIQRALQTRDDVHRAMNRPQNNDTADQALASLDTVLQLLMGSLDSVARVAHLTLNLNKKLYGAGWQSPDWIKELRKIEPDLADLVANGSVGHNTLTILTRLRNSVHGEALAALAVRGPGRHHDTLVGLPRDAIIRVLDAINNLGGEKVWGVTERISGRLHTDPGVLLEQLFPQAIDLLNSLMARTPIERLPNVNLTPENLLPPADPDSPFSERNRQSIRWQLGL